MTYADIHRGGCAYCHHLRAGKCRHPDIGVPVDYHSARRQGQPCGPTAQRWEYFGEDNAND